MQFSYILYEICVQLWYSFPSITSGARGWRHLTEAGPGPNQGRNQKLSDVGSNKNGGSGATLSEKIVDEQANR